MFGKIASVIQKDAFVICDLDDTFFTRKGPCRFMDLEGFIRLYRKVEGRVVFLTAHNDKKEICDRFTCLGLDYNRFHVLYTTIPKGPFLKDFGYPKQTVFIDNSKRQINSVKKHCPDIQCFLFKIDSKP